MFQTSRQVMRFIVLSIGFLLFVVVTIHSAQDARNRQAVVGRPHLSPSVHISGASSLLAASMPNGTSLAAVQAPSAGDASPATSSDPSGDAIEGSTPVSTEPLDHTNTAAAEHSQSATAVAKHTNE